MNATKSRMLAELEGIKGFAWVTAGREIENYLPLPAIQTLHPSAVRSPAQFEAFSDYLSAVAGPETADRFQKTKILFAESILPHLTLPDLEAVLDMNENLDRLVSFVLSCNGKLDA